MAKNRHYSRCLSVCRVLALGLVVAFFLSAVVAHAFCIEQFQMRHDVVSHSHGSEHPLNHLDRQGSEQTKSSGSAHSSDRSCCSQHIQVDPIVMSSVAQPTVDKVARDITPVLAPVVVLADLSDVAPSPDGFGYWGQPSLAPPSAALFIQIRNLRI